MSITSILLSYHSVVVYPPWRWFLWQCGAFFQSIIVQDSTRVESLSFCYCSLFARAWQVRRHINLHNLRFFSVRIPPALQTRIMQYVHDSVRHGERAATGSRHTKGDKPCTLCYDGCKAESAAAANGGLQVHPSSVPQFAGAAADSHWKTAWRAYKRAALHSGSEKYKAQKWAGKIIRLRYWSNPIPQIHTGNLTVEKVTISSYNMLKSEWQIGS